MLKNNKGIKKFIAPASFSLLLIGLLVVLFMMPLNAFANELDNPKKVRVGWYQSIKFQEGSEGEIKSGYCYDYLQKVADYTLWKYEYVYGNWNELFEMLENGEIDMLGGISISDERKEKMLFPQTSMGTDQYYIYCRATDNIDFSDLSSLNGKKAGGIRNNRITFFTEKWIEDNNLDIDIIYFDSLEAQQYSFEHGEIDLYAQTINNATNMDNISAVAKVGEEPFYLAVSKSREDLLLELNESLNTILSIDPFVFQDLQYENYGSTLTSKTLSQKEKEWLDERSMIKVGYLDNYLPFSDSNDDGNATGIVTDVTMAIIMSLNLESVPSVKYKAFSSYNEMMDALKQGTIDAAFPVYGDLWDLEQDGIDASSPVVSCTETFFYKGVFRKAKVKTIAVNENNKMQISYSLRNFPDAKLVYFKTIDECLEAVVDGKADGTIVNSLRTQLVTRNSAYNELSYINFDAEEGRCFGVNGENTALLLLINRGIRLIGSSYGIDNSYKYMDQFFEYTTIDFLRDHSLEMIIIFGIVVTLIIVILVYDLKHKENEVKAKEKHIEEVNALNKKLEELKSEADAANSAKSAFLFNMSHDIRTPMNAIIGYTELIKKHKEDEDKTNYYIEKIENSSQFLLSLINNVLEMARIESGHTVLNEAPWDAAEFNDSLFDVFDDLMQKKNIEFTRVIEAQHRYVMCDSLKLREIFLNILSNAYKYTPEGGKVHMRLEELESDREGYALYKTTISDTGIGISEDYLPHIFEEFTRAQNTTESKIEGTGLGLPIVKKLVELMDGTISVESELGKGSTFIVTLYHGIATADDVHKEDLAEESEKKFDGQKILLAEDNELNAEIAIEILKEAGLDADWASDGQICVDMITNAEDGYYKLILMDIQMPNVNGYEATRMIRRTEGPNANIPIIAMTANAFDEDKQNAMDAGMNGHLSKPIVTKELLKTLAKYI